MAYDFNLRAETPPATTTVTITDVDKAHAVHLPRTCGSVVIQPRTNEGQIAFSGTPGTTLGTVSHDLDADSITEWGVDVERGASQGATLYVEAAVNPTIFVLTLKPRPGIYGV